MEPLSTALSAMWIVAVLKYAIVGFVIPWSIAFVVYRLAFHPLRKYPGPFLAKFTDGHGGFHAVGKRPHLDTYINLRRYGGVYRPAPNRLIFNSLAAVRDIYHNPNVTKARAYRHSRWLDRPNLFDTPDKDEHRRKRKVIGQVVSDRSLRVFEPIMSTQIDIFLCRLRDVARKGEIVNVTEMCRRLAVDVVGYLAFGYPLRTQTETTNRFIPEAMGKAIYMTNLYYTWPALGIFQPLLRWLARKKVFTFQQAVRKMIVARMAEPRDAKPDFYGLASGELNAVGDQLDDSELWNEALFFVTAGGTTVSTAMCGLFFNLSHHPDIYARVAAEIRTVFSSGREIHNGPKLAGCRYLRAVIDESLRLSPPSLSPLWREPDVSSTEAWVVDGHVIPPGTEAAVHLYSVLHHPEYFPEPFVFKPERWLEDEDGGGGTTSAETEEARATARRAQVSFGMGERSCAGKAMAYMETSVTIARTLWYFDFKRAPGEDGFLGGGSGSGGDDEPWTAPDQYQLQDILVADHDGPNLVFTPRKTRKTMAAEIPGYYFGELRPLFPIIAMGKPQLMLADKEKRRYFKIEATQTAPPSAWSTDAVKRREAEDSALEAERQQALVLCGHIRRHELKRDVVASALLDRETAVPVDDADVAAAAWADNVVEKGQIPFVPSFVRYKYPNMPCLYVGGDDVASAPGAVYATLDEETLVSSGITSDDNNRICSDRERGLSFRNEMVRCPQISSIKYHEPSNNVMLTSRETNRGSGLFFFTPSLPDDHYPTAYQRLSNYSRQREGWLAYQTTPGPRGSGMVCLVGTSCGIIRVSANDTISWITPPNLGKCPSEVFDQDFLHSNHNVVVAGGRQPRLWIKDLRTPDTQWTYARNASSIAHVRSVNPHQVLVGGLQNSMLLYDLRFFDRKANGTTPLVRFPGYRNEAHFQTGWDVSTDLGVVAAAHDDGTVKLFSLRSGRRLRCKGLDGIRTETPIQALMFQQMPRERTASLFVGVGPVLNKYSFGALDMEDEA
ncbi:hypothetical protein L249_8582 [Ophiocordyceps polyrhachis-furcata BCC 54312]|uniref:Cytochrome P450 n=1 Tax=Ophiocordyceps polyrhachis-furcata BCC 54312 TaxID=1330021 RepID=A0A367L6A0_9HYPO|nr:hypothetical protein L249_8582 [Ophiocordyceps polyrhachis-furcata BCC 54312]